MVCCLIFLQDVKSGECFRLDHLIKLQFEKKLEDKKVTNEEKEVMKRKITLLDGMTMVVFIFFSFLKTIFLIDYDKL